MLTQFLTFIDDAIIRLLPIAGGWLLIACCISGVLIVAVLWLDMLERILAWRELRAVERARLEVLAEVGARVMRQRLQAGDDRTTAEREREVLNSLSGELLFVDEMVTMRQEAVEETAKHPNVIPMASWDRRSH